MFRCDYRNGTARVIAVIGKEWGHTSGCILGIVVYEFRKGEKLVPVILLIVAIDPQILFQRLIYPFCLPIRLGVVRCGPVALDIEPFEQMSGEVRDKLGAPIRDGVDGEAMEFPNVPIVQLSSLIRRDIGGSGDKMSHLRKAVNTHKDRIITV